MIFQNSCNPSQTDFQETSGVMEWADRTRSQNGRYENLGLNYNGGTGVLTIKGAEADLSSTNPAYVTLPLNSDPNQYRRFRITSNFSFIDDVGASQIIGNLFGLTTGVAHASTIPFFIYAVLNDADNNVEFAISRVPAITNSPSIANSGTPSSATANTAGSFFYFNSITIGDYDTNTCVMLGGIRMTKSVADDWTVTTLSPSDGFGRFYDTSQFTMNAGHYGAAAGNWFANNGGTAPVFASADTVYRINSQRASFNLFFAFLNCTSAGVGAVLLTMAIPFPLAPVSTRSLPMGTGRRIGSTGTNVYLYPLAIFSNTSLVFRNVNDTINAAVNNNDIGTGATVEFQVTGEFFIDPTL